VLKEHWTRTSAWGLLGRPESEVGENLRSFLKETKLKSLSLASPTSKGKFPLDRLRRRLAHILCMDVVFSPRLKEEYINSYWPNSRLPTRKSWVKTDVFKCAPPGALQKCNRICSLLSTIVTDGWKANIVHLLVRLSINIWRMSLRDFYGV